MENTVDNNNFFIYYKPKDIVSGDFYYALAHKPKNGEDELFYLCTADCTGHGVPGALMSMLGISNLNESIIEKEIVEPHEILNNVRKGIIESLDSEDKSEENKDGMDCVLCAFDFKNATLEFAAANNPLWIYRNGEMLEFKPDKMPVGKYHGELNSFSLQKVDLQKGDIVYSFTDGFADQFGGEKGKKFKYKPFQQFLIENASLPLEEQRKKLDTTFENWKGDLEQVDDVLVVAIKI